MGHVWSFGDVRCEIDFIGLDKDEDIRKLRSTEYTGLFFDELEFIEKTLFDEARSRLRYPPEEHGGPTWCGVCAATNAPPEDHWLPIMTGQVEFPPGLSDDEIAEIWRAAGDAASPYGTIVRLLILTGQRRGEVAGMNWGEISDDLATWTMPGERTKNGVAHVVP